MIHRYHLQVVVDNTAELLNSEAYGAGALLRWESAPILAGTYVEDGTQALVSGTSLYDVWGDTSAPVTTYYRTRISDAGGTVFSEYSATLPSATGARITMATLIARLRLMIGDSPGSVFTDVELQDALDRHRTDVLQAPLTARPTLIAAGYQWLDYQARWGFWEDDATISDATWVPLSAGLYTADLLGGHWTFTASILPTLYVTGKTYDLFAAAVDVLRAWQAKAAAEFDFAADGQSFSRSQKGSAIAALAAEYQRKAAPSGRRLVGLFDD